MLKLVWKSECLVALDRLKHELPLKKSNWKRFEITDGLLADDIYHIQDSKRHLKTSFII